jgi:V/A-type H+-transporting ATPase subunit F
MKYSIIGDEDAVLSFGMVGVSGKIATNPDEARNAFQETLEDEEVGIILVTESVADMMRSTVEKYLFTANFPLIVEIPDRKGAKPGRPGMKEMVNAAIGIKL